MRARPPILVAKTIIATPNNVQQLAGRARIRIVLDGERAAISKNAQTKWIPKPSREFPQAAAIEPALEHIASPVSAAQRLAIRTDQPIGKAKIFPHSDHKPTAVGLKCNSAQPVVRVIVFRFELEDFLLLIGDAIIIRVTQQNNAVTHHYVHRAIFTHEQIHCMAKALRKSRPMIQLSIAIGIRNHPDAVARRASILFRPLVRVRFDHEQSPLAIERSTDRRYNLRLLGNEFKLVAAVRHTWLSGARATAKHDTSRRQT